MLALAALLASGSCLFAVWALRDQGAMRRHQAILRHSTVATATIVAKRNLEGDPCGGAYLTVRFQEVTGESISAIVLQQCTGDNQPGDNVIIRYDSVEPTHAELLAEPQTYPAEARLVDVLASGALAAIALVLVASVALTTSNRTTQRAA